MTGRKKIITTCCKNTVNSTAECAEGEKKKKARYWSEPRSYWVIWLQRWPLATFCVESGTVGIGGGAAVKAKETSAVEHSQVCVKNLPKIAHSHAQPTSPSPFPPLRAQLEAGN